jgi:hypothetical protein
VVPAAVRRLAVPGSLHAVGSCPQALGPVSEGGVRLCCLRRLVEPPDVVRSSTGTLIGLSGAEMKKNCAE